MVIFDIRHEANRNIYALVVAPFNDGVVNNVITGLSKIID